ncbi:MAG: hypothetical protein PHN78_06680, partial [Dehalococcoidales bacterium]|nr:hypothetical protein [Dehalococcoidales bacterium]
MVKIRLITRSDITEGMTGIGVSCLERLPQKNWSNDPDERDFQQRRQALYLELIDQFGTCGLLALDENEIV